MAIYSYDPTTARGKVRLLVGDIVKDGEAYVQYTNFVFKDADIDAVLELNSEDVWATAADACRRLAIDEVLGAVLYKTNGMTIDRKDIPRHYMSLAEKYDEKSKAGDLVEFVDSFDHSISEFGEDDTEYVGSII